MIQVGQITLRPWQERNHKILCDILRRGSIALDASDTGTGKTYTAIAVAATLGKRPLVIAPKSVLGSWREVLSAAQIRPLDVRNIESIRRGHGGWYDPAEKRWRLFKDTLIIWDECHRGVSGPKTKTTEMMARLKIYKCPILALSATVADNPLKMRCLGWLFGLHNYNNQSFYQWCLRHGCTRSFVHKGLEFIKGPRALKYMRQIHDALADRMVRAQISQIPEFPENEVVPVLVSVDSEETLEKVNEAYLEVLKKVSEYKVSLLTELLKARQLSEIAKIPMILEKTLSFLEEGNSVVVFLSFHKSIKELSRLLLSRDISHGIIIGDTSELARTQARIDFQTDKTRVLIMQLAAGGVGISLHHTETSQYPRRSIICPDFSAVNFIQAVGRIWRENAQSKSLQEVFLLADSIEENIYRSIKHKLRNLQSLQDSDFTGIEEH